MDSQLFRKLKKIRCEFPLFAFLFVQCILPVVPELITDYISEAMLSQDVYAIYETAPPPYDIVFL